MSDYPPPFPLHGLSEEDISALYDAAWSEIEGSASTQCVVWKGGLRRLIDSYRSLMIATPPTAWRVGDRARVVTDNQYGDGAADIGIEFTVEGLREGARGQTVLLTSTASRGHDGFYADRCAALLDAARAEQKEDVEPVAVLDGKGWVYFGPDVGIEYAPEHPVDSGEMPDATDVRRSTYFEDWLVGENQKLDGKVRELVVNHPPRAEQPVISREAVEAILAEKIFIRALAPHELDRGCSSGYGVFGLDEARDAILALASPGGTASFSPRTENDHQLHPATADLVARFAAAMADKLAAAEAKYGYSDGWASPIWQEECRRQLHHHAAKGDPRDVAAYAAFCWHHGWSTASPGGEQEAVAWRFTSVYGYNASWQYDERDPRDYRDDVASCEPLYASPVRGAGDGLQFSKHAGERWRHVKRGTVYTLPFGRAEAMVQCAEPITDEDVLTIYIGEDGMIFARPTHEFHDGRFELIASGLALSVGGDA